MTPFIQASTTLPQRSEVAKLYVATFNRAPDSSGLDYWATASNLNLDGVALSFFDQPETQSLYPSTYTTENFVKSVYSNLFNRQPDADGLSYWVKEISEGKVPKSLFLLAVINGALDSDATILNNKMSVGIAYANAGLEDLSLAREVMSQINSLSTSVSNAVSQINDAATPAGIQTSEVVGNTAMYNSMATFTIQLTRVPTSSVVLPISSSNLNEGEVSPTSLSFNSTNWDKPQTVTVKGRNKAVIGGKQDYKIVLGAISSSDMHYNQLNPDDIAMKGITLALGQPTSSLTLIPGIRSEIFVPISYTGSKNLSFLLNKYPAGMSISESGVISWIPSSSFEGKSSLVIASATDGVLTATTTFSVTVAQSKAVQTSKKATEIIITDTQTTLNGLSIVSEGDISTQDIKLLASEGIPSIPSTISKVSDAFIFARPYTGQLIMNIPVALNAIDPSALRLFTYYNEDTPHQWFEQFALIELSTDSGGKQVVKLTIDGVGSNPYFIGYDNSAKNIYPQKSSKLFSTYTSGNITCSGFSLPYLGDSYYCTSSQDGDIDIKVYGDYYTGIWESNGTSVTPATIAKWAVDGQTLYNAYGLSYDKKFNIKLEDMGVKNGGTTVKPTQFIDCPGSYSATLGFVTSSENYSTLHLNSSKCMQTIGKMQSTTIHEYFHHAQDRSAKSGESSVIRAIGNRHWITEGTARWMEGVNNPINVTNETIPPFVSFGLNQPHSTANWSSSANAYTKYPFWELVANQCSLRNSNSLAEFFSIPTTEVAGDTSAINNFMNSLENAGCDFGINFGSSGSENLEEALLNYQYETAYLKDSATLGFGSIFANGLRTYQYSDWEVVEDANKSLKQIAVGINFIPKYAALSLLFKSDLFTGVDWDDETKVPTLTIKTDNGKSARAVIMSQSFSFNGDYTGLGSMSYRSFMATSKDEKHSFEEGDDNELFITILNPTGTNIGVSKFVLEWSDSEIEALAQDITTPVNTPVDITLEGTESNDAKLTFFIENSPSRGMISGVLPEITYTPDFDYSGMDSFTFYVSNGSINSEPAAVNISVLPNSWVTSEWGECTGTCSSATKSRIVQCQDANGIILADGACKDTKPIDSQSCVPSSCSGAGTCLAAADQGNEKPMKYTIQTNASSGTFKLDYETYSVPDEMILQYPVGGTLTSWTSGAVGTNGWASHSVSYSGGNVAYIIVRPGPVGTAWMFRLYDSCIIDSQELGDEWFLGGGGGGGGIIIVQ
jgi:hypothetical protein